MAAQLDIQRTVHRDIFLQYNQRDVIISQFYFWNRTLHVSDSFCVHYQESGTVYTAIGICHTGYADCLLASSQHNLYDINLLLCVQCQTPDDGQRNCPKFVEFYSKNKFEKLVHLFGFIIRIWQHRFIIRIWQHRFIATVSAANEMLWNIKSSSVTNWDLIDLFRPRLTVSFKGLPSCLRPFCL